MRIIVVGYGRLGAQVVRHLDRKKHEVIVLDKQRLLFTRPGGREQDVRMLAGNAIDPDVLREAGAEGAGALFALTRDENVNLMVAQVARTVFRIPKVMAVVYDPSREPSYRAAGIETMALTVAGAEYIVSQLDEHPPLFQDVWERAGGHAAEMPVAPLRRDAAGPQYVIIVGGGRVGYFLAKSLLEKNIEVCVIESSKEIFEMVSLQVDCPVILGDGSSTAVLENAGAPRASVFVAVTNHDHDNLIACQIAKQQFGVPRTIARVKNPKNEAVMQKLGVDITVSSTAIMSNVIQSEMPHSRIRQVLELHAGQLELIEYHLESASPVVGKRLREVQVPADCNIVSIFRNGEAVLPRGETALQSGDQVLALVKGPAQADLRRLLLGE